ncbi:MULTISPECIES: hypothetical protein [unclassified Rhizobium]|nr:MULTISPECIES: hypothetical protein [unclassified Rhizobium]MDH7805722.1 hypothetical protein [Rhizobium sp. AN67]MDQ4407196.1 hypothetical protein [Rhizobium sp. AN63]SOD59785.1 hypothetical protein SAMN05216595_4952 [Rhizobium sp. AN6A]
MNLNLSVSLGLGLKAKRSLFPLPDIAPVTNWRVPVLAAYDSAGDAALVSALAAAGANNSRPTYTVAANTTRTIAWRLGEIFAPGGLFSFVCDGPSPTVTMAYSDDSTDGVNGTWTNLNFTLVSPTAFYTGRRQSLLLPARAAGRWSRIVIQNPSTTTAYNIYPLIHQLQASKVRNDAQLIMGASQTTNGFLSLGYEAAIQSAFPTSDPVVFNYGEAGENAAGILTNCAPAVATFSAFCSRVYLDNLIGNDVTSSQPISDDTPSSLTTLRGRVDSIIAAFAGWTVFTSDTTYREYSGVTTSSPNDGSLPYNQQIMWPAILADNPDCYDANTGVSRINLYSWGIFNRNWLMAGDPVHYSDYSTYRAELVRAMEGRVRNGQWPDSYALMLVKRLETERLYHLKREAGYVVNSLPASATKTALQARVDAVTNLLPSRMRISHGPDANAPPVPWTNSARTTAGVAITDIVTEDGFKTSYVWNISLAGNGAFSFGAQGAAQGAEFPDSALLGYLSDTIDSMAVKLTGADASERYRIKAMGSRSGTGTRLQDFVAGGVTQSVNVLGNLSTVADFADLAPTVGEIEMTINRGVGNTTGVYLNGVVVEVLPA